MGNQKAPALRNEACIQDGYSIKHLATGGESDQQLALPALF